MGLQNRSNNNFEITYNPAHKNFLGMFALWMRDADPKEFAKTIDEAPDANMLAEAVAAAKEADVVLFFCGTNKYIETEGADRTDIKLPLGQEQIVEALAEVNPNIVSVIISGGPCDLQVLEKYSKAIVQGWWNGLEGGNALADILYGNIAPSGKLPFTFPVKLEDSPAYAMGNFPQKVEGTDVFAAAHRDDITGGERRRAQRPTPDAHYTEGQYVGYRWFDTKNVPVMYAFGHGLSYVKFDYADLQANKKKYRANDVIKLTFNLTNNGSMEADEVTQVYVKRLDAKVEWPVKELKGFKRVSVAAGQTQQVTIEIPVESLRYWDVDADTWMLENGNIEILVGGSSDDIRLSTQVAI